MSRQSEAYAQNRLSTLSSSSLYGGGGKTLYEGELSWKTGLFSKTKIFATIQKDDPSFYIIDMKKLPRINGVIPDRVDPFEEIGSESEEEYKVLAPGWTKFDLKNCLVVASDSDNKIFSLMENRNDQRQPAKEQRFTTANVCSRTIWVKKLNLAAQFEQQMIKFEEESKAQYETEYFNAFSDSQP